MLKDEILQNWKNAYKMKDIPAKSLWESIKTKILNAEKSGKYQLPLNDNIIEELIVKESKEIKETQSFYKEEDEKYSYYKYQLGLLQPYLPKQFTEDEVKVIVRTIISRGESNPGKITGLTIKQVGNKFDKSKVANLVKEVINENNS